MPGITDLQILFVGCAFLFQVILVAHFALRKWHFDLAARHGWIVYALAIPATLLSVIQLSHGSPWFLWLGGFIYLAWAIFGFTVEYVLKIHWRSSINAPIWGSYITLYLATVMFYWWPLALIHKPLWFVYSVLFVISTYLNLTSHHTDKNMTLERVMK